MEGKTFYFRTAVVAVLTMLMLLGIVLLLYRYQVVEAIDQETAQSINTLSTVENVSAARGEITDRNGEVLVGNETQYQVTLDLNDMGDAAAQGETVLRLLEICQDKGVEWTDSELPVSDTAPYTFTTENVYSYTDSDTGEAVDTRLAQLCDAMGWQRTDSAADLLAQMAEYFGLEDVPEETARQALGVLYSCCLRRSEILWTEYTFASDVGIEFITVVEEEGLPGVDITSESVRSYTTGYAAHLLGRVGLITAENWTEGENYQAQGYRMDATVGQSGIEYAFESYLRGTDGERTITTDREGNVVSVEDTVPAQAGDTVSLTLDLELQAAAEDALAEYIPQLNDSQGGGAAVAVSVSDGSVLACASWPTFDAATQSYDEIYGDLSPLFNRALQGTYSPGSTYKMVTAIAGLETGVINVNTQIRDTGYMDYYGTTFRCWLYRESRTTHGLETVTDALRDSCNIFFYHVGIDVGIDTLTEYAQAFGLGVSTGIELAESTGINAGPEYSASVGQTWYGGNTLSAAIGQSDNLFTPLQLANYVATLVNGGTRYAAHLLQSVTSADGAVTTYEPQVLGTVEISPENLEAVKQGMLEVVESTSTVAQAFANLTAHGIQVGAKTGSAQVTGQENANGLFVCFAPYDDPEIAICVAVEEGGSGAATAVIAARMLEAYFGIESEEEASSDETAGTAQGEDTQADGDDQESAGGETAGQTAQDNAGEGTAGRDTGDGTNDAALPEAPENGETQPEEDAPEDPGTTESPGEGDETPETGETTGETGDGGDGDGVDNGGGA